ncbi:hypothetical protein [Caballeronia sp. S22]|uniref:hypothetical protein n=1 Tax=Caballeronia sp. S22 TaxID=3137182 RepID=UPI003530A19D
MAQHYSELAALRKAGYEPSPWYDNPYYPDDLQAAQRLVDYCFKRSASLTGSRLGVAARLFWFAHGGVPDSRSSSCNRATAFRQSEAGARKVFCSEDLFENRERPSLR